MNDGIVKGEGNSRYMKTVQDALSRYPTYEAFMQALVEGTFPFDLNGINAEGWKLIGTMLNKATLLSDETAARLGGVETVNEALFALAGNFGFRYEQLTTSGTWTAPRNIADNKVHVMCFGGGGGGGYGEYLTNGSGGGGGGGGGYMTEADMIITPGKGYEYEIGAGGKGGYQGAINGITGGTTKFKGPSTIEAAGGNGGTGGSSGVGGNGGNGGSGGGGGGGSLSNGAAGTGSYGGNGGPGRGWNNFADSFGMPGVFAGGGYSGYSSYVGGGGGGGYYGSGGSVLGSTTLSGGGGGGGYSGVGGTGGCLTYSNAGAGTGGTGASGYAGGGGGGAGNAGGGNGAQGIIIITYYTKEAS